MTTVTPSPGARRRGPVRHTISLLLHRNLTLAGWAVGIFVLGAVIAVILVDRYGSVEISVVQFGRQGFIWFPFSIAVMTASSFLNVHVAAGMTRRALGRATLVVGLLTAALYTVVLTAALQVERVVYGSRDWAQQITDDALVFSDTSQVGWILTDLGLLLTAAQLCGLLVGIVYYRAGGWWGTLALPLTIGPIFLVSPLLTTSLLEPLSPLARVPVAVALLGLTALAYLAVLHRVPIRPTAA